MLKPIEANLNVEIVTQPPSGGCVLKHGLKASARKDVYQPPSGGCVLKQIKFGRVGFFPTPAAFRRLCVETTNTASV